MNRDILASQLRRHEGIRLKPYTDTTGHISIGVGRNLTDVGVTAEEAEMLLDHDITRVFTDLSRQLPGFVHLDDPRQHVLLDMAFNLGLGGLLKFERMLAAVARQDYAVAADEMLASRWAEQVGDRATELATMLRAPGDATEV